MNDNSMKKAAQQLLAGMIQREKAGWPPDSFGYIYQAQRPCTLPQQGAEAADEHCVNQE